MFTIALGSPEGTLAQGRPFSISVNAGTEMERYIRVLDLVGKAQVGQWTVRGFGPREMPKVRAGANHPWRSRLASPESAVAKGFSLVAPTVGVLANSSFPYGFNDGPVWAGKGLTLVASGGARSERGRFSIELNPIAFVAQNMDFAIADNGLIGERRFADSRLSEYIDRPQRFGSKAYARLDPGESEARVDVFRLAAGVSTRAEIWGPAHEHPLILGNNAGGIPRVFAGTGAPLSLRWITMSGRIFWGRLDESAYGADTGLERRHFVTAIVGTMRVRGESGVEIGGARFFHTSWPSGGLRKAPLLRTIQAFITKNPLDSGLVYNPDNQLASVFIRIAPRGRGFEVYGEFGREDRNATFRDLILEPDHIGAYMLGFARAWSSPHDGRITVLRGETLNSRISHLQQQRSQSPWYIHSAQLQGHTNRGQVLGSAGGVGGGASTLAVDRYSPSGRTTIRWDRLLIAQALSISGLPQKGLTDLTHAIGIEQSRFTRRGEFTIGGTLIKEFNRGLSGDELSTNISLVYRLFR